MDEIYYTCQSCLHRRVRVFTRSGEIYEGTIVNVDPNYLYLEGGSASISSKKVKVKGFINPFITTLVLFDLLAIALLV
jgi:small nuclear ribonucleoprotein (snRNP)-like protein